MKKINLKGISEILSEKEMKNVMGGCGKDSCNNACNSDSNCSSGCLHCVNVEGAGMGKYCMSQK